MEKVRPWCGQPSDRGRLKNRTKVTVLSSGLLPEILDLEKFAKARRSSKRVISLARLSFVIHLQPFH